MNTRSIAGEDTPGSTTSKSPRRSARRHVLFADIADVAATLAWALRLLTWFVVSGCVASGAAAMGLPELPDWPTRPRLTRWRRATHTLLAEIEDSLS